GGRKISGSLGPRYRRHLVSFVADGKPGSADLVAYFVLRSGALLRQTGTLGLLTTNTISQGETRSVGLSVLVRAGWTIFRAISIQEWPGLAGIHVSTLWMRRGGWDAEVSLDSRPTQGITPGLHSTSRISGDPYSLAA